MNREEISKDYKWNTSDLYLSDDAWEKEFKEVDLAYANLDMDKYQGKLGDKSVLLEFFALTDGLFRKVERLYGYAHMRRDEDMRVSKYSSYMSSMGMLFSKIQSTLAFVEPELTSLDESVLQSFIEDKDFAEYEYKLRKIAMQKAHVLSEAEEKIIALAGDALSGFQDVFMLLDNANLNLPKAKLNGEEVQMSHGLYGLVLHNGTREEREEWFKSYYSAYIKVIDVITQTYYGNIKQDIFYKTARKYDSCLSMAMQGEDVDPVVYNNLLEAVNEALPALHDYIKVRKETLGFEEQHMYDVYVPLVEDADIKVPFDEAYETVIRGLAPLGKEYEKLLRKGREQSWIDVYETESKRSGAYSTATYDCHPYVLLNYQETTNDIFTVAHEMGHAIHSYLSNANQPYTKSHYTIFLAEIASTVNEVLLLKYLYNSTQDTKLKKYLLNYYMDSIRATLFRQSQFAQFEQAAHEMAEKGEPLNKENLCALYYDLNKKYYGEHLVHDEEIAYEWARIPHFYNSFYVYKYATGIISAISIVKRILTEGESAVKDYFAFLSSGGCTDPVTILKRAGVDLTTKEPFEAAMNEFKETLEEFKKLS